MKIVLKTRITDLKKYRSKAISKPELWHLLDVIDKQIKANKKLYFDLYGLYEMGRRSK